MWAFARAILVLYYFVEYLRVIASTKGINLPIEPIKVRNHKDAKALRIAAVEGPLRQGRLFFAAGLPGWQDLVKQFCEWNPRVQGRRNDEIDTVSLMVQHYTSQQQGFNSIPSTGLPWFLRAPGVDYFNELKPTAMDVAVGVDILPQEVAWEGEELSDEAALQIVLSDVNTAETYIQGKNGPLDWENYDNLYRGVTNKASWPGTEVQRASLVMPVVLEAIEKLLPSIYLSFFSDKQPFLIEPRGQTTPVSARALSHLLQWAVKQSDFPEAIRRTLKSCLLYGTGHLRYSWCIDSERQASYAYTEDNSGVERQVKDVEISYPSVEHVEIRNILVDPGCREQDVRKARYVVAQIFVDASELDYLRADTTYKNVPTKAQLTEALATGSESTTDSMKGSKYETWRDLQAEKQDAAVSVDPTKKPLELLEYVTDDRIITVLQRMIVIRNEANEFESKTYLSSNFIDVLGSHYGFGVGKLLASEQLLQTSVVNKWLDSLALLLNPPFTEQKGLGGGSQQIKIAPGKILTSVGTLTPVPIPSVTKEAIEAMAASEERATKRVGANGGDNMPSQALRTAEGVNAFNQGIVDKLQYFIEIFSRLVFVPALEALLELCLRKLKPQDIKQILSDADAQALSSDMLAIYNGKVSISTLSSTKLAARRAAAQLVPFLFQLLSAQPFSDALASQNKKFDYVEFMSETVDLAGWDINSLIVDATPEDVQRHMQMAQSSQAGKAQGEQQLEAQKNQDVLQQIDATGMMRAGVLTVKHALDQSGKAEESANPQSANGV